MNNVYLTYSETDTHHIYNVLFPFTFIINGYDIHQILNTSKFRAHRMDSLALPSVLYLQFKIPHKEL